MERASGTGVSEGHAHVVPTVMLAALVLVVLVSWAVAPNAKPLVVVYGDSLTVQSETDARAIHRGDGERIIFRAAGGTAMCDWIRQARVDEALLHPARVVLAFTGNTVSCVAAAFHRDGAAGATGVYEQSLRQMREIFARAPVTIVIPPAMRGVQGGWFPYNGNPALVAMYKRVGSELGMTINTRADDWLTPGHVYTATRPAYPHGPMVVVRLADGVHLTPAGELWYGAALLD